MADTTELQGEDRLAAIQTLRAKHYTHSVPSGKAYYYQHGSALVVMSIPANQFIGRFLFGVERTVWELSRLWAPDGHERNLLTAAISGSVKMFKQRQAGVWGLVSYADPNVGHAGFVYRAASWLPCGQVAESRYYQATDGQVVSRRKFHSGRTGMTKRQIIDAGYTETKRPGRLRYRLPLSSTARREFLWRWGVSGERRCA